MAHTMGEGGETKMSPSFYQMVLNSKWHVQEGRKGIRMSVLTKIAPRPNDDQKSYIQDKRGPE